ncbi:MAG: beta strand repeat-containing protein [Bryobacteraceae bacterium]
MKRAAACAYLLSVCLTILQAQTAPPSVPRLVKFTGTLPASTGWPSGGAVGVMFALYEEEHGGAPLWMETQNIRADANGRYTATLGSTRSEGIPAEVFASGQGRWLGVQPEGQPEMPRVLMVSVPYALKAVDADTLGGLPPSAFALANAAPATVHSPGGSTTAPRAAQPAADAAPNLTGTGTANHLAYWTNGTTIGSSVLYQTAGKIGLGTTSPGGKLEVDNATATAIIGNATATSGNLNGVQGQSASTSGDGVTGIATATSGSATGVWAQTSSPNGNGLYAVNNATSGYAFGIQGTSNSPNGVGVQGNVVAPNGSAVTGINNATSGFAPGVSGASASPNGAGVSGGNSASSGGIGGNFISSATSGYSNGVYGQSSSTSGNGVFGNNNATSGFAVGVNGQTSSPNGTGVNGLNMATSGGNGVQGQTSGTNANGVFGVNNATTTFAVGVNGQTYSPAGTGVNGLNLATTGGNGVQGQSNATSGGNGVYGQSSSTSGNGVLGIDNATSGFAVGVNGQTSSPNGVGVNGLNLATTGGTGVTGQSNATSGYAVGVYGQSASPSGTGVNGVNTSSAGGNGGFFSCQATTALCFGLQGFASGAGSVGMQGTSPNVAVAGFNQTCSGSTCTLVKGTAGQFVTGAGGTVLQGIGGTTQVFYVDASGNGYFAGNLKVTGRMTKGSGSFMIDHPLDPEHKYLSHSFVESPDMMDVYNGVVRLDAKGQAWVDLPDYFEALNGDFRYQLTAMGAPAPRLFVAQEVAHNRFKIAGGHPGGRVSWQVTGIRHDAYANAHRIAVTEDKPAAEQGTYLHPDAYGAAGAGDNVKPAAAGLPQ